MKKSLRFAACALSAALVCQCALPAFAAEKTIKKDENVFVTLAPDGSISDQTVSEWVHSDAGFANVKDQSTLTDITNLKTDETPVVKNGFLSWDANDTDVYYQGSANGQLPVTAKITYAIDGTEMTAEEAMGKSGHLVITIALTNHETHRAAIDGIARTIATPFVTVIGTNLPVNNFENVTAEHGIVETDSANQIVGFIALPGVKKSLDGLATGSLSSLNDYLLDTVTIEADVTDLAVPSIMIASAVDSDLLSGNSASGKMDDLFADLDKLDDATGELLDGSSQLADGAAKLYAGAQELSNGTAKLATGTAELSNGLTTLSGKSKELTDGAQQIANAVLDSANTQLAAALTSGGYTGQIPTLTWENYSAAIDAILGEAGTEAQTVARNGLKDAIRATGVADDASINAVLYTANRMVQDGNNDAVAPLLTAAGAKATNAAKMQAVQTALASGFYTQPAVQTVLTSMAIGSIMQEHSVDAATAQQIWGGLSDDQKSDALATAFGTVKGTMDPTGAYDDATLQLVFTAAAMSYEATSPAGFDLNAFIPYLSAAQAMAVDAQYVATAPADDSALVARVIALSGALESTNKSLATLRSSLDGVTGFIKGLGDYTNAVATASGYASEISSGAGTLNSKVTELLDGAKSLSDGSTTLHDGLVTYDKDGIIKLTDSQELANARSAVKVLDEMQSAAESYGSYAGAPDDAEVKVKFVMKTTAPKAEKKTVSSDEKAAVKTSFWDRIKNLFQ